MKPIIKYNKDRTEFIEIRKDIEIVYRFNAKTKQLLESYPLSAYNKLMEGASDEELKKELKID
jgi:hypothetical protein